eukprot:TRINITY_DN15592_c0_g1::TRINITY_DN15592_c0_g1_i1::g.28558::m.28558 TRINITY_DN15592_c0_g1::TRINITY_DN15592_c0_g1_i1::g.28558  ORF type:complete len:400 (-),score=11.47,TF_Zn_Ribbon/PF08271.7/0.093 TRINITY_DN15592_c0_g1_i1:150-1259(-)
MFGFIAEGERYSVDQARDACWDNTMGDDTSDSAAAGLGLACVILTSLAFLLAVSLGHCCFCKVAQLHLAFVIIFAWLGYLAHFFTIGLSSRIEYYHGDASSASLAGTDVDGDDNDTWKTTNSSCYYVGDGYFAGGAASGLVSVMLASYFYLRILHMQLVNAPILLPDSEAHVAVAILNESGKPSCPNCGILLEDLPISPPTATLLQPPGTSQDLNSTLNTTLNASINSDSSFQSLTKLKPTSSSIIQSQTQNPLQNTQSNAPNSALIHCTCGTILANPVSQMAFSSAKSKAFSKYSALDFPLQKKQPPKSPQNGLYPAPITSQDYDPALELEMQVRDNYVSAKQGYEYPPYSVALPSSKMSYTPLPASL